MVNMFHMILAKTVQPKHNLCSRERFMTACQSTCFAAFLATLLDQPFLGPLCLFFKAKAPLLTHTHTPLAMHRSTLYTLEKARFPVSWAPCWRKGDPSGAQLIPRDGMNSNAPWAEPPVEWAQLSPCDQTVAEPARPEVHCFIHSCDDGTNIHNWCGNSWSHSHVAVCKSRLMINSGYSNQGRVISTGNRS